MQISVANHERRTIYVSPDKPSYVCWVRLWKMPDGGIMTGFTQATGPIEGRPSAPTEVRRRLNWPPPDRPKYDMTGLHMENVYLRSTDGGKTWTEVATDPFTSCMNAAVRPGGEVALADGTVLRVVWGQYLPYSDVPQTGYIQRSTDGTKSWGPPELLTDDSRLQVWPGRVRTLSDGRVAVMGAAIPYDPDNWSRGEEHMKKMRICMWVSEDTQGRRWSEPLYTVPNADRFDRLTEEWDIAELENGDLFCLYRVHQPGLGRVQNVLVKDGNTWKPTPAETAPFKQTGFPEVLMTREGGVLYIATDGLWATTDRGKRWSRLTKEGTGYYPKAIQLDDDTILAAGHHGGGDSPYGTRLSIIMDIWKIQTEE
mgnify:CR=1 FL=1